MAPANEEVRDGSVLVVPYEDFVSSLIPLYAGPQVSIRIGQASPEYRLSKSLLCKQSPYFRAAFEGKFQEGEEQSLTLTEEDGVVSVQSFEMLVQWLYLGQVVFGSHVAPEERISAIIEFVRFADMCGVTSADAVMAAQLKEVIISNPAPSTYTSKQPEYNNYCLVPRHIKSASVLPHGHRVRVVLAEASVTGYLTRTNYKFWKEAQDVPNFSVDLLNAVRETLKTFVSSNPNIQFTDPISGKVIVLRHYGD